MKRCISNGSRSASTRLKHRQMNLSCDLNLSIPYFSVSAQHRL